MIDSQANFADTFNWLVQSMNNLKGEKGCKVEWAASDMPTISIDNDTSPQMGGGGGGEGEGNPVVSITATDSEGGVQLDWTYADGTSDSHFFSSGGGGGEGSYVDSLNGKKGDITLVKEDDTNITFTVDGDNIKVGVYYL